MSDREDLERRASEGDTDAMFELRELMFGIAAEQNDLEVARSWWLKAADRGNTDAMFGLGIRADDDGNLDEARKWFTRVGEQEPQQAGFALYRLGERVEEAGDAASAQSLYEQAASFNDADATYQIGRAHV